MSNLIKPDISVNIGRLKLKNPILTASGTFGYADEYDDFMNVSNIGAIVTKGITLNPKTGNPQPRIKEVKNGLINSIGLENVGIQDFIDKKLPVLKENNIDFILNIAGASIEEYIEIAKICQSNNIETVELNLSCPNVKSGCLEFGKDEKTLYKLVSEVRKNFDNTLIVKLSSNVSFPEKMAKTAEKGGADAISAINTVKAMNIDINKNLKGFKSIKGGLSGSCIKPLALNFIYEIRQHIAIPIIGMGGISCFQDMLEFFAVGADAVQIGTANFTHPDLSDTLVIELNNFMKQQNYGSLAELVRDLRYEY
ncbi:MAG: dihydroorotate dehydrogenase B catalytic subunit [Candidatus Melainabacteria bacterium GWA2_34_9]|nr:MAG: dihydroorotate dehydrogenase B catalytic subunit [Candidatus Melainabacteria bacterium GWA2_34_9]